MIILLIKCRYDISLLEITVAVAQCYSERMHTYIYRTRA